MTTIIKSNNAFGGAATLSEITEITHSAQDLYDEYAARVVADGGAVQDATACLAAITAAVQGGYFFKSAFAISARWGVKLSGANIVKFYNLVDSAMDGTVAGVIEQDLVKETWATAKFDNAAADIITFTGLTVNKTGKMAFVGSTGDHSSVNNGLFMLFTPAAEVWNLGEYDAIAIINGSTKIDADFALADNQAVAVLIEQDTTRFTIFADGVRREVATSAFTALAANATATLQIKANLATVYMNEMWFMNAATEAAVESCCFDLGARY